LTGVSPSGIFPTTNYNDPKEVIMNPNYNYLDIDFDVEDYGEDYSIVSPNDLTEMAEDYGYGWRERNSDIVDTNYDFDNYGYAD
jgi:hypothetical protein